MPKLLLVALLAALLAGSSFSVAKVNTGLIPLHPSIAQMRSTVVAITTISADGKNINYCSGAAQGPNTFSTAQHCFHHYRACPLPDNVDNYCDDKYTLATVNGVSVIMVSKGDDPKDRTTIIESGVVFSHWSKIGPVPKQGDRVRWWGTQVPYPYLYRQGYISYISDEGMLVDGTVCHGDSGGALYNDNGEIVGVASQIFPPPPDPTDKDPEPQPACAFLKIYNMPTGKE